MYYFSSVIIDSTCGDMTWMQKFLKGKKLLTFKNNLGNNFTGRDDIIYTGYDLIPINIANAKKRFSNETWSFSTWDLVRDKISKLAPNSTAL